MWTNCPSPLFCIKKKNLTNQEIQVFPAKWPLKKPVLSLRQVLVSENVKWIKILLWMKTCKRTQMKVTFGLHFGTKGLSVDWLDLHVADLSASRMTSFTWCSVKFYAPFTDALIRNLLPLWKWSSELEWCFQCLCRSHWEDSISMYAHHVAKDGILMMSFPMLTCFETLSELSGHKVRQLWEEETAFLPEGDTAPRSPCLQMMGQHWTCCVYFPGLFALKLSVSAKIFPSHPATWKAMLLSFSLTPIMKSIDWVHLTRMTLFLMGTTHMKAASIWWRISTIAPQSAISVSHQSIMNWAIILHLGRLAQLFAVRCRGAVWREDPIAEGVVTIWIFFLAEMKGSVYNRVCQCFLLPFTFALCFNFGWINRKEERKKETVPTVPREEPTKCVLRWWLWGNSFWYWLHLFSSLLISTRGRLVWSDNHFTDHVYQDEVWQAWIVSVCYFYLVPSFFTKEP